MSTTSPAPSATVVGRSRATVDTPALLLDLDRFERNVERLASSILAGG